MMMAGLGRRGVQIAVLRQPIPQAARAGPGRRSWQGRQAAVQYVRYCSCARIRIRMSDLPYNTQHNIYPTAARQQYYKYVIKHQLNIDICTITYFNAHYASAHQCIMFNHCVCTNSKCQVSYRIIIVFCGLPLLLVPSFIDRHCTP